MKKGKLEKKWRKSVSILILETYYSSDTVYLITKYNDK